MEAARAPIHLRDERPHGFGYMKISLIRRAHLPSHLDLVLAQRLQAPRNLASEANNGRPLRSEFVAHPKGADRRRERHHFIVSEAKNGGGARNRTGVQERLVPGPTCVADGYLARGAVHRQPTPQASYGIVSECQAVGSPAFLARKVSPDPTATGEPWADGEGWCLGSHRHGGGLDLTAEIHMDNIVVRVRS